MSVILEVAAGVFIAQIARAFVLSYFWRRRNRRLQMERNLNPRYADPREKPIQERSLFSMMQDVY